jgi:hypothetical protein
MLEVLAMAARKPKRIPKKKSPARKQVRAKAAAKKTAVTKTAVKKAVARKVTRRKQVGQDVPSLFRLTIEVANLDDAQEFYSKLFGTPGSRQPGGRVYFNAGAVLLQVLDISSSGEPHPAAKALYFTVRDLDAIHARATFLGALSEELVHGKPGGDVAVRPWGERSFYAQDPWANPLCFVEAGSTYGG